MTALTPIITAVLGAVAGYFICLLVCGFRDKNIAKQIEQARREMRRLRHACDELAEQETSP